MILTEGCFKEPYSDLKQPFFTTAQGVIYMKTVILDSATLGDDLQVSTFFNIGELVEYKTTPPEEVINRISDCDVVVLNKVKLGEEQISAAKNLKLIAVTATGYDNVSIDSCKKHNVALCNVSGYSTDSVAQTTVASALYLSMHLPYFDNFVKDGSYTKSGVQNRLSPVFYEFRNKTWGIVGYGNIGKQVAAVAEAMGCKILAYARTNKSGVECVDIDTLCEQSDIISIHLPLSAETKELINADKLAKMKKNVILVNAARGAVTDESAIADAIESGKIGAFATDVYSVEPIQENSPLTRLYNKDNVLFTPHLGWGAYEARIRCIEEVVKNIDAFFKNEKRNRIV